jgi:hypothetical protein
MTEEPGMGSQWQTPIYPGLVRGFVVARVV